MTRTIPIGALLLVVATCTLSAAVAEGAPTITRTGCHLVKAKEVGAIIGRPVTLVSDDPGGCAYLCAVKGCVNRPDGPYDIELKFVGGFSQEQFASVRRSERDGAITKSFASLGGMGREAFVVGYKTTRPIKSWSTVHVLIGTTCGPATTDDCWLFVASVLNVPLAKAVLLARKIVSRM